MENEYPSIQELFANYNGDYTPIEFDACDIGKEALFDTSCLSSIETMLLKTNET